MRSPELNFSSSTIPGGWVSPDRNWVDAAPKTPDGATPAGLPLRWPRCCPRSVVPLALRALQLE